MRTAKEKESNIGLVYGSFRLSGVVFREVFQISGEQLKLQDDRAVFQVQIEQVDKSSPLIDSFKTALR